MWSICTKDIPLNSVSVLGLDQDLGHIDTFLTSTLFRVMYIWCIYTLI